MSEKLTVKVGPITDPTDAELAEMGLSRESYNAQVKEQMEDIGAVLNGFFDVRKAINQPEPSDEEVDRLLELFGNIKYHAILFNQFKSGQILFNVDPSGKIQIVTLVDSGLSSEIPKNRTLN